MDSSEQHSQLVNQSSSFRTGNFLNFNNTRPSFDERNNFSSYYSVSNNNHSSTTPVNERYTNTFLHNFFPEEDLDFFFENFNHNTYSLDVEIEETNNEIEEELLSSNENNSSNHQDSSTVNSNDIFLGDNPQLETNNQNQLNHFGISDNNFHSINKKENNNETDSPNDLQNTDLNKSMPFIAYSSLNRFKNSQQFKLLDTCYFFINKLGIYKYQGKFDLKNEEANEVCRELFEQLSLLQQQFKVKFTNRNYRKNFSQGYISLYEEDSFGYLTEILDSAQEATPYLVINGEKFIFSKEVIDYGTQLFVSFCALLSIISDTIILMSEEVTIDNIVKIKKDIQSALIDFDKKLALYEEKYITELISIEKISRRFIFEGIKLEKELTKYENKLLIKGRVNISKDKEYNRIRGEFIKVLNELNKVANINGKGRDDLDISILLQSENVLCKITELKSKGLRKLALNIKKSLNDFRELFSKYNKNIEEVDPQLANNPDLVSALDNFEILWEKGKKYLTYQKNYNHLLIFNQIVELINEKYPNKQISKLIEQSDPAIFVTIPAVLILQSIDNGNIDIIKEFIPNIDKQSDENGKVYCLLSSTIKEVYSKIKDSYYGYNLFERFVLFDETEDEEKSNNEMSKYLTIETIKEFKKNIKILSINMQRYKPIDWNEFFQLAMEVD